MPKVLPRLLVTVQAPHFTAGLVIDEEVCVDAAPILKWALGWTRPNLRKYFERKGWKTIVRQLEKE